MADFNVQDWALWAFGGCGVVAVGFIYRLIAGKNDDNKTVISSSSNNSQVVNVNLNNNCDAGVNKSLDKNSCKSIEEIRSISRILFIDDEKFRVVDILKKNGWINTRTVKDIKDMNSDEIKLNNIFFVDIQGVGKALEFKDEGLGLALAIKSQYPEKKVIIYSAQTTGERFHEALKRADDFLPKNAEPYEFIQIVERFSREIFS